MAHSLTDEELKEIAGQLDCGNRCYYNRQTKKFLFTPDFENNFDADEELFEEELEELETNFDEYVEIEKPNSSDSFEIMENFVESLDDKNVFKSKLTNALSKKKPFSEFKFVIDNSGGLRQQWFDFKNEQLNNWVIEKMRNYIL
jgi:hypothetical protein